MNMPERAEGLALLARSPGFRLLLLGLLRGVSVIVPPPSGYHT